MSNRDFQRGVEYLRRTLAENQQLVRNTDAQRRSAFVVREVRKATGSGK